MKIAVVGMGLFGQSLSRQLARNGAQVIAIDQNPHLIDDIKSDVDLAVRLDATDERELRAQGIHEVDVLVASIGDNFEANQMLILVAKCMGIKRVIARAPSSTHARILSLIGADEVVMPEESAAMELARRMVQPSIKGYMELIEGTSVAELQAPADFVGKNLVELDLKRKARVSLVAIKHPDPSQPSGFRIRVVLLGTDVIEQGDVLVVLGRDEDIKAMMPHGEV